MFQRIIIIVLDSVGIGAMPDAHEYGDSGANTLGNIVRKRRVSLPVLTRLGIGCIAPLNGVEAVSKPQAFYSKMAELSRGKDTTTGHWELAGAPVFKPFPYYPDGFPAEIMDKFSILTGRQALGNRPASGTEIIAELGEEHMRTGKPIVYTSADSVFQIAAHEEIIPLEELYSICHIVRERLMVGKHAVARIIARPFIGEPGRFTRTPNRHDYSLTPEADTMLDRLQAAGLSVVGVGKIGDIYAQRGLSKSYPTKSNEHGVDVLLSLLQERKDAGLIMTNLVEFDSSFGHRRDSEGYASALEAFDRRLPEIITRLEAQDLLIITADHGCDPTAPGTDHTREYVPLLVYHQQIGSGDSLGIRQSFADVSATILENFSLAPLAYGESFLRQVR